MKYLFLFLILFIIGCRENPASKPLQSDVIKCDTPLINSETVIRHTVSVSQSNKIIYGDTIWVYPYGTKLWYDTIINERFSAFASVWVDTTDYLIDTVNSPKGWRIAVGYNHFYEISIRDNKEEWLKTSFNKKESLAPLLKGSEYWTESNLNVFKNLSYNEKYKKFVIEYDLNPRFNYGTSYFLVINLQGEIDFMGISSNWGGGGPDGEAFISSDEELYITCNEVYSFCSNTSENIADYTFMAQRRDNEHKKYKYNQLHAVRKLSLNTFLTVFNPLKISSDSNALILNTDTTINGKFKYYGLMEEMDAILLFYSLDSLNKYYLYDSFRKVLVCISESDSVSVKEFPLSKMKHLGNDSLDLTNYSVLEFEAFSSYIFYASAEDSMIYYSIESLE